MYIVRACSNHWVKSPWKHAENNWSVIFRVFPRGSIILCEFPRAFGPVVRAEVISTGQPASNTKAFSDSRLNLEWRFKHESEKVPEKVGRNHWSHVTRNWFLLERVLTTRPKALGNTQRITELFSACFQGPLAQWLEHALTIYIYICIYIYMYIYVYKYICIYMYIYIWF